MIKQHVFKMYYILVLLLCTGLVAMKFVTSFWIPEWSPAFYIVSGLLGVFAIGRLVLKTFRLYVSERRLGQGLIVLAPLHYEEKKNNPSTLSGFIVRAAVLATVVASVVGGERYAQAHNLLPFQSQPSSVCVSQPTPMPRVPNDVPSLNSWQKSGNATFGYTKTDGFLGSPSLAISSTSGTSAWVYPPKPALAGNTYQYADWYTSNIKTTLVIKYVLNGTTRYQTIDPNIPATKGWRHYSVAFDMPDNPGNSDFLPVSVMQQIHGNGKLEISDVVLHQQTSSFVRPMISLTFDDGWLSQYTNALPLLCKYHMPATFYLISSYIEKGYADYMLPNMVSKLAESGMEIGDHTVDHPHLPELSSTAVEAEISDSKAYLGRFGQKIVDFASPYGEVNDEDLRLIRQLYQSHRSTDEGLNNATDFDPYNILCVTIYAWEGTLIRNIKHWIDLAIKTKTWLVLAFHQIEGTGGKYYNDPYNASPVFVEQVLSYINDRHVQPMTINEGLSEVFQQI